MPDSQPIGVLITDHAATPKTVAFLRRLVLRRRQIGAALIAGTLLGGVYALAGPRSYVASARFLPRSTMGLDQLPLGGGLAEAAQSVLSMEVVMPGRSGQIYRDLVTSEWVLDRVLAAQVQSQRGEVRAVREHLRVGTGPRERLEGYEALRRVTRLEVDSRSGVVTVAVSMRDGELAAHTANALLDALNAYFVDTRAARATENRRFLERKVQESRSALRAAEENLQQFQAQNRQIGLAPQLQLEQTRLLREFRLQEQLFLALSQQLELAKMEETRRVPVLEFLDRAFAPPTPARPRKALSIVLGALLGLVLGSMGIVTEPLLLRLRGVDWSRV